MEDDDLFVYIGIKSGYNTNIAAFFGGGGMRKRFNTSGACFEDLHYMVNLDSRVEKIIQELILQNKYFSINRARQYGKTTMLDVLYRRLMKTCSVFLLSFEDLGSASFSDEYHFCRAFLRLLKTQIDYGMTTGISESVLAEVRRCMEQRDIDFPMLKDFITYMCTNVDSAVVLIIDEVDQASNNQIFLDFLSILRSMYLKRRYIKTFQSVILTSVYDIKNLKIKLRPDEEHKYNSPWNIAADFEIDMSFSAGDIAGMLREYEHDYSTGMDIQGISQMIWEYTEGYPYLVSRICQFIDEQVAGSADYPDRSAAWSREGILVAVKKLLEEQNTLFDDMGKKLSDVKGLDHMIRLILFHGKQIPYNPDDEAVRLGSMFGYLKKKDGVVAVSNRIFETRLYNRYLSENIMEDALLDAANMGKNQFITDGCLNMDLVMEKFMLHFTEIYGDSEVCFLEENGRRIFLTYLRPIINGTGNYYVEARTRDNRRTDVIVDYLGKQYVIEMKLWHGDEYNRRGELQLAGYLDDYGLDKGYLLSFNFNKNKKTGMKEIECGGKRILEVVV